MANTKFPNASQQPRLLQIMQWIADPLSYLDACARKHGDIFTLRLVSINPLVFLSHPQAIQEIFTADAKQFDSGRANSLVRPLVGEHSLLVLDGASHQRQRRLLMPPFHGERMHSYSQLICESANRVASQWVVGQPFQVQAAMQGITLEVILHAVFGLSEGERYQQLKPLLAAMLNMTDSPLRSSMLFLKFLQKDLGNWSPWGRMMRRKQQICDLLQAEINERRTQPELSGNDVLSLMMSARDENGQPMTDAELNDELITLLFAGHETTATALAWAFYWIHKLPPVREKLLSELDSLGDEPEPMANVQSTRFANARLPYLNAVCSETLRIYPVVFFAFPRVTKLPIEIMGHHFDSNTTLIPCTYLTHRREDLYPEPNQFKPERFIERQFSPYEYLPFGGGNRRCLGLALAQLEMKLVLATILSNYQLDLADSKPVKPQRRGLTIAPTGGIQMVLRGPRHRKEQTSQTTKLSRI